jgi:tetratricopeptide (TPR) repeat protein
LLKLAEFQLIVRQHGEALKTIDQVMKNDPQNPEAFFMAGRVALDKGDTTNAILMLQKCVRFDAMNADAWMFLGQIASNRRRPEAIQYFDNVLRIDSTVLDARELKAAYYKKNGEFEKAFGVYQDIILRNPDYSNAYFDIGMIYLELDSLSGAYNNFSIAIKTDPLFFKAFYYRGIAAEEQGNLTAAYEDYRQAAGMAPDFKEAVEAAARLKKKLGL